MTHLRRRPLRGQSSPRIPVLRSSQREEHLFIGQHILKGGILTGTLLRPGDAACHLYLYGTRLPFGDITLFVFSL